ncbi:hypothetical protein HQ865_19160 [Mucilaginibacter mali]|uniref:Lipoprotein n=1 Tax=Mucilaginibacter mali TaxID=2740462 RepID=A0A7D4TR12_9SPHI|nr:hypothetical protein [Mucilaginibacter mali]QKJ31794.1 hypothetical protein HQ865_19160 [Mucilaginibacter mali]
MKNKLINFLLGLMPLLLGCNNTSHNGIVKSNSIHKTRMSFCHYSVEDLKKQIIGRPLKELPIFPCYVCRDTILFGDDDIEWNGKAYYKNNQLAFLAETNWSDKIKITRITIFDKNIQVNTGIGIGTTLKRLRPNINIKPSSNPDGYLSFNDRTDRNIFYFMNVDKYPELADGRVDDANKMPNDIVVKFIVISQK